MTAILILEKYNLQDTVVVKYPENYSFTGKVAYINEDVEITVENLLEFLLIYSANDAAYIAALSVSDNINDFTNLMNQKAKDLNMTKTKYANPDGIDEDNHYTTILDLLNLTLSAIKNNELLTILSKSNFLSDATGTEKIFNNTNLLVNEGYSGVKTGWTDRAGLTFIGLNSTNNRQIVTIVNKSIVDENKYNHFLDTKMLYELSIETFKNTILLEKNQEIYNIRNAKKEYKYKSEKKWIEFINKNEYINLKLENYDKSNILFKFKDFKRNYKIKNSDSLIKWKFQPIKLFKLFANNN